ncbi:hypothetical protein NPIL_612111 [Nephila pilipes]|uniref:Uncharacterized protein n=1 Tax=Nephila pilipes TaxID=299642 RepID=A0A8X6U922_NEPPI|nr:hypothetical protein NPIL_612111 [Nephila pilipes]
MGAGNYMWRPLQYLPPKPIINKLSLIPSTVDADRHVASRLCVGKGVRGKVYRQVFSIAAVKERQVDYDRDVKAARRGGRQYSLKRWHVQKPGKSGKLACEGRGRLWGTAEFEGTYEMFSPSASVYWKRE